MNKLVRQILSILEPNEKRQFFVLLFVIIGMGITEVVGVVSIFPFMQIASNPQAVETNKWLSWGYESLGFQSTNAFITFLGFSVIACLTFNASFTVFGNWYQQKVVWNCMSALSVRLLNQYAHQPYTFFLREGTSDLGGKVLVEVTQLTTKVLLPLAQLLSGAIVSLSILALLFVVDLRLAALLIATLGGAYMAMYLGIRSLTYQMGIDRRTATLAKFRFAGELLDCIKVVKIHGREETFVRRFEGESHKVAVIEPKLALFSSSPRYLIEAVAFTGIILIIMFQLNSKGTVEDILPTLSLFAIACYRLLPSLQKVFVAASTLRYSKPILDSLCNDMKNMEPAKIEPTDVEKLKFKDKIVLKNLQFKYDRGDQPVLNGVDLEIKKNQIVAFVGPSGAGKTTLVDILIGLIKPSNGEILIDETSLNNINPRAWQKIAGYVPQDVRLYDDTVANNIAFGCRPHEVDLRRVEEAARIANIHEFISKELEQGYQTNAGEQGTRMSGGQRQRIGLARALYHDPEVLILDEATSALDGVTEEGVMESLREEAKNRTIIMIAHRLSTVKQCDVIFLLENGRVIAQGNYDDLINGNELFMKMARMNSAETVG
ncbi:MAG: ABC transporter ATP-binding protein [Pirellulaceae bacterium]